MAGTLARPGARAVSVPIVRTLAPSDVDALRLPGTAGAQTTRRLLERNPGRSVWVPETLEYALIGAWRNRCEIACVEDLVAVRHLEPLLHAAVERCAAQGDALLLAIELDVPRSPSRFERAGLELLEEVITYEAEISRGPWSSSSRIRAIRVDADDASSVDLVTEMDQGAFPWLWRNSRAEFDVYLRMPGVEVAVIEADDEPVAYFGVTLFSGWGHLDRIAVAPHAQGRGYGLEALGLAVEAMRQRGARRAGLSTQRTNLRSQRLYERFGFRRTSDHDYRLFGAWCRPDLRAPE
ncbi:MAG TPA: GNAT family N-acetyltransferase [Thermomicrobiales bacterium]|nr:GNAT family N-acetyltransferase [Thermomicrobiales bacterium]